MAASREVLVRVYGEGFGQPPFQNADGTQSAFSNFKQYPAAPLTSVNLEGANVWPLVTGFWTGAFYVYSVIVQPPTGLNQPSIKLATDTSVATIRSSAT